MAGAFDIKDLERRMKGAEDTLRHELSGLRTGRASAALLDPVTVEVYGTSMPLNQVASIAVPEPRMISIQVWDKSNVTPVEKAIRASGLGLNPVVEGQLIRLPIPQLTEERRQELIKVAHKYAEQARVAIRNVRRDGLEHLKRMEKDEHLGEDDSRHHAGEVQKLTDRAIAEVDQILATKEKEIQQV
ncbi:MAG TPA: ribosome recycling factor [Sphingomonadales bacterium]|nr:ribosome recycling factor [Sphingomonadales bacterium]